MGVFERSLYGIGKTAYSADRFIGGGTNVSFELGNETFYWLIKACHQIHIHFESNNHMNEMLSDIHDCHEEVTIKHFDVNSLRSCSMPVCNHNENSKILLFHSIFVT